MTEERLNELARQLGARAAERLNVEATAQKVVARLREEPVRRTAWISQTWLRIAAALVVVVGGGLVLRQRLATPGHTPGVSRHTPHLVADDLGDLSTDELRDVLTSLDDIITTDNVAVPDSTTDLRQLDPQQLRAVLRSLEG